MISQARPLTFDACRDRTVADRRLRVCQIMSADLWAGAEVQVATTASYLTTRPDVVLTAVLFNDGWLADQLRRLGVEVAIVDEQRNSALRIAAFVRRFLVEHAIDIVHTHRCKDTVLGALAAKSAGVPHVVRTVHGLSEALSGWKRAKLAAYDIVDKAVLWCFGDRIIAVSHGMAASMQTSGYKAQAVTCIHNGINLGEVATTRTSAETRRAVGIAADALVIGSAGRLAPVKGHEYLIRAASQVLMSAPHARFLFVGSGPLRDELITLARTLHVDHACVFIDPSIDRRAGIYDLIAAMDVFVLPSLSEGVPMALLEAMALGRPAVATAVGGVPEVIADRVNGMLVPPGDERALAATCLELAQHTARASEIGARAREAVGARFSHELNGDALVRLYREVARDQDAATYGSAAFPTVMTIALAPLLMLLARVRRKATHAIERRRVERLRRSPAAVVQALRSAKNILVVCHGNIIRSPFAAHLLARALAGRARVSVASAGLEAERGRPSHPIAIKTAAKLGFDLTGHSAAPLSLDDVVRADAIFVMDVPQLVALTRRFPAARRKTFLLTCLACDEPLEIRDPVDAPPSMFHRCYDHISRAVASLAPALSGVEGPVFAGRME